MRENVIAALPRTSNGIVIGAWRAVHRRDPAYAGSFGPVSFRDGKATTPLAGPLAHRFFVLFAADFVLEPWPGELPAGWTPPPGIPMEIPPEVLSLFPSRDGEALTKTEPSDELTAEPLVEEPEPVVGADPAPANPIPAVLDAEPEPEPESAPARWAPPPSPARKPIRR